MPEVGYTAKDMADDVSHLMDHLGLGKIHFSGLSLGGAIGQEFALAYPDKVKSLSLVSTWAGGPCRTWKIGWRCAPGLSRRPTPS